jgi:Putative Ig domain
MKRFLLIAALSCFMGCGTGPGITFPNGGSVEITTGSLPDATEGAYYVFQLTASGGKGTHYVWAGSGFPDGVDISTSGLVSGTPKRSGTFQVSVTVQAE